MATFTHYVPGRWNNAGTPINKEYLIAHSEFDRIARETHAMPETTWCSYQYANHPDPCTYHKAWMRMWASSRANAMELIELAEELAKDPTYKDAELMAKIAKKDREWWKKLDSDPRTRVADFPKL